LMRFVPHLRDEDTVGHEKLQTLEHHFQKEEFTKGFHIIKQAEHDEYLYYIFSGQCRMLLSTRMQPMTRVFPQSVKERSEWLVLDTLRKGQAFGEITSLNKERSPYTIEVCSDKAILLKIHINQFIWYFGGDEGEPVLHKRSKIIMKTNWLRMKKQFLAYMSKEKLQQLEYRDDSCYNLLEPTCTGIKEVPYM